MSVRTAITRFYNGTLCEEEAVQFFEYKMCCYAYNKNEYAKFNRVKCFSPSARKWLRPFHAIE